MPDSELPQDSTTAVKQYDLYLDATKTEAEVRNLRKKLESDALKNNPNQDPHDTQILQSKIAELEERKSEIALRISNSFLQPSTSGSSNIYQFNRGIFSKKLNWALTANELELSKSGHIPKKILIPIPAFEKIELVLRNHSIHHFKASLQCLGNAQFQSLLSNQELSQNYSHHFSWEQQSFTLLLENQSLPCTLNLIDTAERNSYSYRIESEQTNIGPLRNLRKNFEVCSPYHDASAGSLETFFHKTQNAQLTCAQEIPFIKNLDDPIESLTERFEMLAGQKISFSDFAQGKLKLDETKFPKLDGIVISSFKIFDGKITNLLLQLLRWHAIKGVPIYILQSHVLSDDDTKSKLFALAEAYSNVKIDYFSFNTNLATNANEFISQFHRSNHTKIFATYSASVPSANKVILGGRNLGDDYFFAEAVNKGTGEKTFEDARLIDLDFLIQDVEFTKKMFAQFFSFMDYDPMTYILRPFTIYGSTPATSTQFENISQTASDGILVRHFYSVPYSDNSSLEKMYIDLINSAQKSIEIFTPYFNLTEGLLNAFRKAHERGVIVKLITGSDLSDDTASFITLDINRDTFNKSMNFITVYEMQVYKQVLHTKLVMIDGQLSVLGSVNLNQRSFFHDTENALFVWSKSFNKSLERVTESYYRKSKILSGKQKVNFLYKFMIRLHSKEF